MSPIVVRRLGARAARELSTTLVGIHREVYAALPFGADPYFTPACFAQRLAIAIWQPRFELIQAEVDGEIAGYLYGWALPRHTRWWSPLTASLPPDQTEETGERSVFIQEIMVRQAFRRRGIARLLHDGFLAERTEQRALLCVLPDNEPARLAYLNWGWHTLATTAFGAGEPVFACMTKQLTAPARVGS